MLSDWNSDSTRTLVSIPVRRDQGLWVTSRLMLIPMPPGRLTISNTITVTARTFRPSIDTTWWRRLWIIRGERFSFRCVNGGRIRSGNGGNHTGTLGEQQVILVIIGIRSWVISTRTKLSIRTLLPEDGMTQVFFEYFIL